jgi:hypothetical protein
MRTGYAGPPSRSSTSRSCGCPAHGTVPPSIASTVSDDSGRNGVSSVLQSSTSCSATCRTESRRAGSSFSFQGAWSDRYLFASATTFIVSASAARCCDRFSSPPIDPNASRLACRTRWSSPVSSPGSGMLPTFLATIDSERLTRLPQPATSSVLLRVTNCSQVKSVSLDSGPAAASMYRSGSAPYRSSTSRT